MTPPAARNPEGGAGTLNGRRSLGIAVLRLPVPDFSRDVWLVSLTMAMLGGAYLGMMQLVKVLYVLRLGQGPEFVGSLFATGALSFAASSLFAGALGQRYGPRRIMIAGGIICTSGMAIMPLTELLPPALRPFWVLLVQVISSSGWSLVVVNHIAALMTFTTAENRQRGYALKEAFLGLGTFLGALIGGLLPGAFAGLSHLASSEPAPYRHTLCVATAIAATALVPLLLISEAQASVPSQEGRTTSPPLPSLSRLFACAFLNNAAVASQKAFASAYMDRALGLPTSSVGAITSAGQLLAVLGALLSARLVRSRGSSRTMAIASTGLGLSLLLLAALPHPAVTAMGTTGALSLAAVWVPAFQVLQMETVAAEWRSWTAGAGSMALSLGFGTLSLGGGYVVAELGYPWVFLVGALSAVISATLAGTMGRSEARGKMVSPGPAAA
jgi:predicted MFS family arabinose efflux permease